MYFLQMNCLKTGYSISPEAECFEQPFLHSFEFRIVSLTRHAKWGHSVVRLNLNSLRSMFLDMPYYCCGLLSCGGSAGDPTGLGEGPPGFIFPKIVSNIERALFSF